MNDSRIYQITVKFEDSIIYMTYIKAPANQEEVLRDFVYQQFQDEQPNLSMYSVVDMKENSNAFIENLLGKNPKRVTPQSCLANLASEYANKYQ